MNILRNALGNLSETLFRFASSEVVYRRGTLEKRLDALWGRTRYTWLEKSGLRTGSYVHDFLITAEKLSWEPEVGDRILADGEWFEVLPFGPDECYRFSDPFGLILRIHTKRLGKNDELGNGSRG